ncbi:esterase/lipase family protein [Amycolatopsis sp. NPDC057786]|uniref:esterase/lipase family protein n=1 Tax=Amycolatopsis sp. NPDC057786 TaxID=3346250 RepID=UPI0036725CE1
MLFHQAPKLKDAGYCVYSLNYGATVLGGQLFGGLPSMRKSAVELGVFVDRVRTSTGADKVKHFVGFGSNFKGTSLDGLSWPTACAGVPRIPGAVGVPRRSRPRRRDRAGADLHEHREPPRSSVCWTNRA